jgi:hypothetical protein
MESSEKGTNTPDQREEAQRVILVAFQKGTFLIALSVAVITIAALATVVLILASRRATLRHINAGLLEIGDQLKKLRQPPG